MEQEAAQNAWDLYDGSIAGATSDIYITTQVLVNPEMNKLHLLFLSHSNIMFTRPWLVKYISGGCSGVTLVLFLLANLNM